MNRWNRQINIDLMNFMQSAIHSAQQEVGVCFFELHRRFDFENIVMWSLRTEQYPVCLDSLDQEGCLLSCRGACFAIPNQFDTHE